VCVFVYMCACVYVCACVRVCACITEEKKKKRSPATHKYAHLSYVAVRADFQSETEILKSQCITIQRDYTAAF